MSLKKELEHALNSSYGVMRIIDHQGKTWARQIPEFQMLEQQLKQCDAEAAKHKFWEDMMMPTNTLASLKKVEPKLLRPECS